MRRPDWWSRLLRWRWRRPKAPLALTYAPTPAGLAALSASLEGGATPADDAMPDDGFLRIWPLEAFVTHDGPDKRCPAVIDLTGRSRDLVFGPYQALPAGIWRVVARLSVCKDAARCRLAVEFGVYPNYTREILPFGVPGVHTIRIEHALAEEGPAEFRIVLTRAAFHGLLRFEGARLLKVGEVSEAEAPPEALIRSA